MLTGSCLCTVNKYIITNEDAAVLRKVTNPYFRTSIICHCPRCRKIGGGYTTTNLVMSKTSFKLKSSWKWCSLIPGISKISTSTFNAVLPDDKHGHICFCRHCGSVLYREAKMQGWRGLIFVPVGTLDDIDSVSDLRKEEWY
ncbi:uncharacterized protein N7482_005881 [Penicillium canariense]|uniref:CENP-V/GFA domain-containing protein n=1 Tax=Penicillium canariense TaxID=189055 RepID=A0A9W9I390_9EURO|nr:uncharacterized protein N7482_005881 [Penicillium canariense]KAJ5167100.1 hypothetical protein N7482_005881 [Penicillium canariense]